MESSKKAELREELREINRRFDELTEQFLANRAKLNGIDESKETLNKEADEILAKQDKIMIRVDEILTELRRG